MGRTRAGRRAQELLESLRSESAADGRALQQVMDALGRAETAAELVTAALTVLRQQFGWRYASAWQVDDDGTAMRQFAGDGRASDAFVQHTATLRLVRGNGLPGSCWERGELVISGDFDQDTQGIDVAAILAEGFRSGLAFPLLVDGRVVAAMQFLDDTVGLPSPQRLTVLRAVGTLVSLHFERLRERDIQREHSSDVTAMTTIARLMAQAQDADEAMRVAVDAIRDAFGWDYGTFWKIDPATQALVFAHESGEVGRAFRQATRSATFARGVGISGRVWETGEMVIIPDLVDVSDCVRAAAARDAGVHSGVCLPIEVGGELVGTLDFFVTRSVELSESRIVALRNTAFLVGQALERFTAALRLDGVAQSLFDSIQEVESNVGAATSVAARGAELSEATNDRVAALARASGEISQVVRVIQEIAAQTNLLALNATIEAARAGDAGKGFAVVAGEVKDLAAETARATTQVESKVHAISSEVSAITEALADIAVAVSEINASQDSIAVVVAQQVDMVRGVVSHGSSGTAAAIDGDAVAAPAQR